jgi:CubicO group peptidase (beta-lactamase class C family)
MTKYGTAFAPIAVLWASTAAAVPPDFKAKADALLAQSYAADGPGATVIVIDHGRIAYSHGRGLADVAAGKPITADTVFRLASITKQFTAAVILQLAEEGKLSLTDPVSRFFPDYPKPGADATVAQLLNHTSGIYNSISLDALQGEKPAEATTTEALIAEFRDKPAQFPAGTKAAYGGSGYVLLGAIIEKLTGRPWYEAIEKRLSKPLGLSTIGYSQAPDAIPSMAVPYTLNGDKVVPARPYHLSWGHAGGGLVGSISDFAKWSMALHGGKVLKSESYRQMIAPVRLLSGEQASYGLGLDNRDVRGRRTIFHGGSGPGISNGGIYVPEEDLFVAILSNIEPRPSTYTIALRLVALAMNDPYPAFTRADVPMADLEPLFGVYKSSAGERRLFARGAKLFMRGSVGGDVEVQPAGRDVFFYPGSLTWFSIARDSAGKHVMTIHANGGQQGDSAVRTGALPVEVGQSTP